MVKQGQFLLQIDPSTAAATVKQWEANAASAKAQQEQAKANLMQAKNAYQRSLDLKKANAQFVTAEQLEQLKTTVDVNEALLQSAGHQVDQALASLDNAQVAARQDHHLRPHVRPRHAAQRRAGRNGHPGHAEQGRRHAAHDQRHVGARDEGEGRRNRRVADCRRRLARSSRSTPSPTPRSSGSVTEISNSSVAGPPSTTTASTDQAVDYQVTIRLLNRAQ